jgi:insertion element IS1 protein InsB
MPYVSSWARTDISLGVCLPWSLACCKATDRRYGHECERHSRYRAGVARKSHHGHQRTQKKAPQLQQVNQTVLQHLHPAQVEVAIYRADALTQRRGLTSELDEMWSYVGKKAEPRWLWHAIDHHRGTVLAYVFGRRKDEVFLELKELLAPFGITRFYTDGWGAYERHLDPEQHTIGKAHTQKIESKHINLRTRIKRLVRRTICFSKTITMHDLVLGFFINRYEFGGAI